MYNCEFENEDTYNFDDIQILSQKSEKQKKDRIDGGMKQELKLYEKLYENTPVLQLYQNLVDSGFSPPVPERNSYVKNSNSLTFKPYQMGGNRNFKSKLGDPFSQNTEKPGF